MAVILDTSTLTPGERTDALSEAMASASVPAATTPQHDGQFYARLEAWPLGPGGALFRRRSTGVRILRTARQIRDNSADRIALTLISPGAWRFSQTRAEHAPARNGGTLILVDHTAPYEFNRYDSGTTVAVNLDLHALDLPHDTVRAAVQRMTPRHPLHHAVSQQLRVLVRCAEHDEASLHLMHRATRQLARALIADVAGDTSRARTAYHDSLFARSQLYLALHATDPGLTPERIALAQHISIRQLYKTWQGTGSTIGQAIIRQRLIVSRQLLRDPAAATATIAEISRRSGFADPTHFTHRFTEAFGETPREWRAQVLRGGSSSSSRPDDHPAGANPSR
jgi:AraC-like DNA-binding protein